MNFPSTEFDDAVAGACQGTGSADGIAGLHAMLRDNAAARDEYLWQVELHAFLAARALRPMTGADVTASESRPAAPVRQFDLFPWALAATALSVAFAVWFYRPEPILPQRARNIAARGPSDRDRTETVDPDRQVESPSGAAAGIIRPNVQFAVAADAPTIVGSGGRKPIELGADVLYPEAGDALHVWDWSRSPRSRVVDNVRLQADDQICLTPDGTQLVWGKGEILNLVTGERSQIDLGGESYVGYRGGTLRRIERLQFSPDGRRLAMLVANLALTETTHPLRPRDLANAPQFQIVEFPSGKLVCEIPAGIPADLPLALSHDSQRAVSQYSQGQSASQLVEHNAVTGGVLREYEPRLREYACALGYSVDGTLLAALDSAGELLVWDARTGKFLHRFSVPGNSPSPAHLRFSPDGKWLAVSLFPGLAPRLVLVDVTAGAIAASVAQEHSGEIHWSADSRSFDVVYDNRGYREDTDSSGRPLLFNMYPTVKNWKVAELRGK